MYVHVCGAICVDKCAYMCVCVPMTARRQTRGSFLSLHSLCFWRQGFSLTWNLLPHSVFDLGLGVGTVNLGFPDYTLPTEVWPQALASLFENFYFIFFLIEHFKNSRSVWHQFTHWCSEIRGNLKQKHRSPSLLPLFMCFDRAIRCHKFLDKYISTQWSHWLKSILFF